MPHLSIIVPVYNAEGCLNELWQRLKSAIETITDNFEVLLIDDASQDKSWDVILKLASTDNRVKGFKFSRNFGQHYGITAGIDYCQGDFAVVMDCDLQDQPEEIPKLYEKAQQGYDIVLARRIDRQDRMIKRILSWVFYKIFNYFLDHKYDGSVGNFRIISKKVILTFRTMRENLRFFGAMINWMGYKKAGIDVQHAKHSKSKSTYTFKKLRRLASDTIIAYSDKPLSFAIRLGWIMALGAICYGIFVIIRAFIYDLAVPNSTSLIIALYFIGGNIIWILGIIGIYLGKTFEETKKRPLYIIEEVTN